jgi:hypothetical protein
VRLRGEKPKPGVCGARISKSVQKTVDAISAELRLLPNLEEVTRGTSVLLPNATKMEKEDAVSI